MVEGKAGDGVAHLHSYDHHWQGGGRRYVAGGWQAIPWRREGNETSTLLLQDWFDRHANVSKNGLACRTSFPKGRYRESSGIYRGVATGGI